MVTRGDALWTRRRSSTVPRPPGLGVEWAPNRRNNIWYARVVYIRNHTDMIDTWFPHTHLASALP